ncbi:Curli production assembly/transport component CsgG [Pontimicrobium aquaticum]|uniref:Curli production assembly/transport component CsgG n=1 Tax=Pontimicrobium aquaticum TaxID=2565367 RepID=UPI001EF0E116|nr:Curli production assembly/transport component CsgG [Pontimicrobium aquaticum]
MFSVFCLFLSLLFFYNISYGQEKAKSTKIKTLNKGYNSEVRGTNALSVAFGAAIANADYPEALFEVNMHVAYKRFLGPYVNINIGYNKYNLAFKDVFNEGFMSFDVNLEIIPFSKNIFSPFVYAGGGVNASNYFVTTDTKTQGGAGFEVLISPSVGVKLFAEYNMMFTDELDGRIYGASDDAFWRAAIGLNFYFGKRGKRRNVNKNEPTVINSNPIIHSKN